MNLEQANKYDQLAMKRLQTKREAMSAFRLRDLNGDFMHKYSFAYKAYRVADDELFCFMAEHNIAEGY